MSFNILDFIDQLESDGGTNNPRGDHSYKCPHCGAPNFKVNVVTGKWFPYGCDCASSEEGKRAIRHALSPAKNPNQRENIPLKPIRPKRQRTWTYCDPEGNPILEVHRSDDGQGNRKIWQRSLVTGSRPRDVASQVVPQGFHQAKRVIPDGASVLAMRNYVPHMAGRLTIRQIERDYGPIDQYEWIVLPADHVPLVIGGKLIPAGRSRVGARIKHVISEAEANGMQCNKANSSIIVCSRS
jgi:hypothetical protein